MNQRMKCPHCSKVADFHNDFCTLCWSHRNKGKVLTEEQIAQTEASYAKVVAQQKWQAAFDKYQKLVIPPAVILTICVVAWIAGLAPALAAGDVPWLWMTLPGMSLLGFALGGYLVGGCHQLRLATVLLGLGALAYGYVGVESISISLAGDSDLSDVLWGGTEIAMCAIILYGSYHIFRMDRKMAN